MPKKITSLPIEGSKLRDLLVAKAEKVDSIAQTLGCTRQTLHQWFTSNRIPARQLLTITRAFSLTAEEVRQIRPREELCVLFRTLRDVSVPDSTQKTVKTLANEVISLNRSESPFKSGKVIARFRTSSPVEMANHIRNLLDLPHRGIVLEQIISSLEALNIPVIFFPFDQSLEDAKVCAFTASILDDRIIFVDSNCAYEDVAWRIFHELAHILLGHDSSITKEDERFCDNVASEYLTPAKFFEDNRDLIRDKFDTNELWRLPGIVREIAAYLGASYLGVIIALTQNKVISAGSAKHRYLFKVHHQENDSRRCVRDFISPTKGEELEFWTRTINDLSIIKLLKLQLLTRDGLFSGKVSLERAAEIFMVDVGTMQELKHRWTIQDAEPAIG